MDEADRLCDRIAIVDHGELKALDSPLQLKAAVPSMNSLEASFGATPPDWKARLERLPGVERVSASGAVYRIATSSGPETTRALLIEAERDRVEVASLAVQSTSLDDVFVHYTGRDLRDALQEPSAADRHIRLRQS
jgi:ABC-2 type transport system ATP-binding protein